MELLFITIKECRSVTEHLFITIKEHMSDVGISIVKLGDEIKGFLWSKAGLFKGVDMADTIWECHTRDALQQFLMVVLWVPILHGNVHNVIFRCAQVFGKGGFRHMESGEGASCG